MRLLEARRDPQTFDTRYVVHLDEQRVVYSELDPEAAPIPDPEWVREWTFGRPFDAPDELGLDWDGWSEYDATTLDTVRGLAVAELAALTTPEDDPEVAPAVDVAPVVLGVEGDEL